MEITTLSEAVKSWKNGELVWSAELGGIGPGYEQAIQILLWEILARWKGPDYSGQEFRSYPHRYSAHVDQVVSDLNDPCRGFSGAQVDAAKSAAFKFLVFGYKEMMNKLEKDRHILVSKGFPHVPEEPKGGE